MAIESQVPMAIGSDFYRPSIDMAVGKIIWTYFEGSWHQGNPPVMGAADHGMWLGTLVFDGARAFEGVVPDLVPHCQRVNDSATALGLNPTLTVDEIVALVLEGLEKFESGAPVYIRPMYWSTEGMPSVVLADPESTTFALCLELLNMPPTDAVQTLTRTSFVRPLLSMATVNAKAACLYPNNARMLREAQSKGFDNALVADPMGNVAETATSNVFLVKDNIVQTPEPNGTFLNGITRQRAITLLREDGYQVLESQLTFDDFDRADEVFTTGNVSKITPIVRFDDVHFQPGPVAARVRQLYWEWAHAGP